MPFFDNLTKKVGDAAKTAAKKSGDLVETTKLNMAVNSEEDKIKAICTDIGKSVYLKFQSGADIDPELLDKCQQIRSIEENIASLKQKISQLKSSGYNESPQYGGMPPAGQQYQQYQQYQQAPPQYMPGYNPGQSQAPPQYVPTSGIPQSSGMPQYSPTPNYSIPQMQPETPLQSVPVAGSQEYQAAPQYSPVQEAVPYQAAAQDMPQPGWQGAPGEPQAAPAAQPNTCPSCGTSVLPGTKFCPSCGNKLF